MKKILILTISLIGTLALTGCDSDRFTAEGEVMCPTDGNGCEVTVIGTYEFKSYDTNYDLSLARLNISQSNIDITANSGTIVLSVKSLTTTKGVTVINWFKSGNYIYVSNPSAANQWLNNLVVDSDQIIMDVTGIYFDPKIGGNTFTAVFEYNSSSIIGISDSFYLNNADLNGF